MHHEFGVALRITWLTLMVYWMWSARKAKPGIRGESAFKRIALYWLPLVAAASLLGPGEWFGHTLLREQFVPHGPLFESIGLAFCVAGAALACWSRHLLGRNWSGVVELKQDHELIEAGPYRRVRHPIYTGLLLLFFGNAVMVGDWRGLLAVAIVFASFWHKLRVEERWLGEYFGARYADYRRRTRALFPGLL